MVEVLKLPYRTIESISCVGPFFWSAWDQDEEDPHLRKHQVFQMFTIILILPRNRLPQIRRPQKRLHPRLGTNPLPLHKHDPHHRILQRHPLLGHSSQHQAPQSLLLADLPPPPPPHHNLLARHLLQNREETARSTRLAASARERRVHALGDPGTGELR